MIPTYNPRHEYLKETLLSVLQQDPGPEQMQVEAVDDCSTGMDVAALVKAIASLSGSNFLEPPGIWVFGWLLERLHRTFARPMGAYFASG